MKLIPVKVSQFAGHQMLKAKAGSPKALFGLGIAGTVVSTVLACRATLKLEATLIDIQSKVEETKAEAPNDNKALATTYAHSAVRIVRLYGPAFLVGSASISALTTSHVTLQRRNASIMAAYSTLSSAYDGYRERVRTHLGEETELDLYRGVSLKEAEIDGKKQLVRSYDPNQLSPYAVIFDEASPNWKKVAEYNKVFLKANQQYFNNMLQARGYVFLNEVLEQLGLPMTSAGQVVGWVISDASDCYVDFGLYEARNSDFVNSVETSIVLDFNVDGVIYNLIDGINHR